MAPFRSCAVVGLGYVGLPLALELACAGYLVYGVDVNEDKVKCLREGISDVCDVPKEALAEVVRKGALIPTSDYRVVEQADVLVICVPTPLGKTRDPDISYVMSAVESISPYLRHGHLVLLESTVYPGVTEELVLPRLAQGGLKVGNDFFLAFSPERVDPGNRIFGIRDIPKVIGGITPECTKKAAEFYASFVEEVVPVSSARVAEMVKLLENVFRAVNIALVNETAIMCERMGIDIWEVIAAAATKPYGFMPFHPGPGIGGHCIPVDPVYLSWKVRTMGYRYRFIELATDVNSEIPRYVVEKVAEILNLEGKAVRGSKVLILGITYKPDVSDTRESPALEIYHLLRGRGAIVDYHDPFVKSFNYFGIEVQSVALTERSVSQYDILVLTTNHSCFDYFWLAEHAKVIFDTRNGFDGVSRPNIFKIGAPLRRAARVLAAAADPDN